MISLKVPVVDYQFLDEIAKRRAVLEHIFRRTAGIVAKRFCSKKPFYHSFKKMAASVIDDYKAAPLMHDSDAPHTDGATNRRLVKLLTGFFLLADSLYRTLNIKKLKSVLRAKTYIEYSRLVINNLTNLSNLADKILYTIAKYEVEVSPSKISSEAMDKPRAKSIVEWLSGEYGSSSC